jgi:hypothetical protein
MPTYGWILEDDREAFLSATDPVTPTGDPREVYFCPFCASSFDDHQGLQTHITAHHHVERPALLVAGEEPPPKAILRRRILGRDVLLTNTTAASIAINGGQARLVTPSDVPRVLAEQHFSEVWLRLSNACQPQTTPVSTEYAVAFRVADASQLSAVEVAFETVIVSGTLSRHSIRAFVEDPRCQGVTADYAEGLSAYALGVLVKERPEAEDLTTVFSTYRDRFGAAFSILSEIDRPLARLICDIISFATNDFSKTSLRSGYWELDVANVFLKQVGQAELPKAPATERSRTPICPIDHGTDQILALVSHLARQTRWSPILDDECRKTAMLATLDALDINKALAAWAIAAWRLGARESAIEPLQAIAGAYPFSSWASSYLESVSE